MAVTRSGPYRLIRGVLKRVYRTVRPSILGQPRDIPNDFSMVVPFGYQLDGVTPPGPIAVVCHLFHEELSGEILEFLSNIPFPADVYISTNTEAKRDIIAKVFSAWSQGTVDIRLSPNIGRDISAKLVTFADIYQKYGLVVFLHSKRSLTSSIGDEWRSTLFRSLLGSPDTVRSIVEIFSRYPDVGVVMSQHFEPISRFLTWHGNYNLAKRLAVRMGFSLTPQHVLDFPSGSMFWARPEAIGPLLKLHLQYTDFHREQGQTNGTIAHAIERLFLYVCENAGYRWVKIADPAVFPGLQTMKPVADAGALADFMARHTDPLLGAKV